MSNYEYISAFIVAGGKSSRMGTDKALSKFKGKQLVLYILETLETYNFRTYISSNNESHSMFGYQIIRDEIKNIGPIGGLYSCLRHSETKYNLFFPCDVPFINPKIIDLLIENKDKGNIIVPMHKDGKIEPLIALYNKNVIDILKNNIIEKTYSLTSLMDKTITHYIILENHFSDKELSSFVNINTKKDLEEYERIS